MDRAELYATLHGKDTRIPEYIGHDDNGNVVTYVTVMLCPEGEELEGTVRRLNDIDAYTLCGASFNHIGPVTFPEPITAIVNGNFDKFVTEMEVWAPLDEWGYNKLSEQSNQNANIIIETMHALILGNEAILSLQMRTQAEKN